MLIVSFYALGSVLLLPLAGPAYGAGAAWAGGAVPLGAILVEIGLVYRLVVDMGGRRAAPAGPPWFYVGSLLALLALICAVVVLQLPGLTDRAAVTAILVAVLIGFAAIMLLQAWPVAMAARTGWVSPLRILRATRGHRHHLLFALIVVGVLNGVPETEPMQPALHRLALGVAQFGATMLQTLLLGGLASAAWNAACANDPGLRGEAIPD